MTRRPFLAAVSVLLLLSACVANPAAKTKPTGTVGKKASPAPASAAQTTAVSGVVQAPAGIISGGAGNIISGGAGNIISGGAGNIISGGAGNFTGDFGALASRRLLAVDESPLADTHVYLVVKGLEPNANSPHAVTNAKGEYTFDKVPSCGNYTAVAIAKDAGGKPVNLTTLVKAGEAGARGDISLATTCVSLALLDDVTGGLADFNTADFSAAVEATQGALTVETVPDLSNVKSVTTWMDKLSGKLPILSGALEKFVTNQFGKELDAAKAAACVDDALADAAKQLEDAGKQLEDAGKQVDGAGKRLDDALKRAGL